MSFRTFADRARVRRAAKKQQRQPGTDAEWAMVNLTRRMFGVTLFTAALAVGATVFTGLQWWEAHTGSETANKQATAAVDLARAARAQVGVAASQVAVAKDQVRAAKEAAGIERQQLTQSRDLFAEEQRPIVQYDPSEPHTKLGVRALEDGGGFEWFYGVQSVGKSSAYKVRTTESLSVYGRAPQTNVRNDPRIFVPGQQRWAQATYRYKPGEGPGDGFPYPKIIVRFDYFDGQGRQWSSDFCRQLSPNGTTGEC